MSDLAQTTRHSVADNFSLIVAVAAIVGSVAWMTSSLRNEMDARFQALDVRFDAIDARLDGMDNRLDRMENRLERMDGQLFILTERLARVETGVFGYELPAPLETPPEDDSSPLPETTPEQDPVAGL